MKDIKRGIIDICIVLVDYATDEHPYSKEKDNSETWSEYNRGWNDACDYIRNIIS